MAILPIITAPDPRLKRRAKPVEQVDDRIRTLMDDMLETMYRAPGIGLAAPQVGVLENVIVIDFSKEEGERHPLKLANPVIVETSEVTILCEEGCLSLPDHFAEVERPARIRVRYLDYENEIREIAAEGMLATCIQHEMDHLQGILFVDRISPLKRGMILRKLRKTKKLEAAVGA